LAPNGFEVPDDTAELGDGDGGSDLVKEDLELFLGAELEAFERVHLRLLLHRLALKSLMKLPSLQQQSLPPFVKIGRFLLLDLCLFSI
jgi:hypothetical protein